MKRSGFFLAAVFTLLFSCSCSTRSGDWRIHFPEELECTQALPDEEPQDLYESGRTFRKFSTDSRGNLKKFADPEGSFLWVRLKFDVPEEHAGKNLALLIPYLHFSEKAYLNGTYIGSYGRFPPETLSAQYKSHFFLLEKSLLDIEETNEILIKIYCLGNSTISGKLFIGEEDSVRKADVTINHIKSSVYLLFEGGMFAGAILFFLLFVYRKRNRTYFSFALLNAIGIVLASPLFAAEVPWYTSMGIPYMVFMKVTLFCLMPFATFTASQFMLSYMEYKSPRWLFALRLSASIVSSALCLFINEYHVLMKICPYIVAVLLVQLVSGLFIPFTSNLTSEQELRIKKLFMSFSPLLTAMFLDFLLKFLLQDDHLPYFTFFGFQITDITFFVLFMIDFNKVVAESENLNEKMESEVKRQTRALTESKDRLESEIRRSKIDLEMAAIVQVGFLPEKKSIFQNFGLSVLYEPLSNVSGDFYDYYEKDGRLAGFSLFDVSGHGIAASLITLLGKNVVSACFADSLLDGRGTSKTLRDVNRRICNEKGNIDNYLTGLLFRIDQNSYLDERTNITFANAGHPHPLLFRARTKEVIELKPKDEQVQYGAIGLFEHEVEYAEITFYMEDGDILVCYTDGLTEAFNRNREEFGLERLKKTMANLNPDEHILISEKIRIALTEFTDNAPREDDLTYLVLKKDSRLKGLEEL